MSKDPTRIKQTLMVLLTILVVGLIKLAPNRALKAASLLVWLSFSKSSSLWPSKLYVVTVSELSSPSWANAVKLPKVEACRLKCLLLNFPMKRLTTKEIGVKQTTIKAKTQLMMNMKTMVMMIVTTPSKKTAKAFTKPV